MCLLARSEKAISTVFRAASALDPGRSARVAGRIFGVFRDLPTVLRSVYLLDEIDRMGTASMLRTILDFGCGPGLQACLLGMLLPDTRVVGVDVKDQHVARSVGLAARLGLDNVDFICDRVPPNPCREGFDLVIAFDILEHVRDDAALLDGLCAGLADRGRLLVHVPAAIHEPAEELPHGHVREYEPGVLLGMLRARGMALVDEQFTFTGAMGDMSQCAELRMSSDFGLLVRLARRAAYVLSYHRNVRRAIALAGDCRASTDAWPDRKLPLELLVQAQRRSSGDGS